MKYEEGWLARRLRDHGGSDIFDGFAPFDVRKDRMREAIKLLGVQGVIVGSENGYPVEWQEAFHRVYKEAL